MSSHEIIRKLAQKVDRLLSPGKNLRRIAYALDGLSLRNLECEYHERPEYGPSNLGEKLARQAVGGPFEPLDIALVNRAAAHLAISNKSILEVGSGTGMFATLVADACPESRITASEFDNITREWAAKNRNRKNITYCRKSLQEFANDEFDLTVALEVVEHIHEYAGFLRQLSRVAPQAIISTPNRLRSAFDAIANPPTYECHVREWSSEAFYWVLRVFWNDVKLYTIPNIRKQIRKSQTDERYQPNIARIGIHCREHVMIAVCNAPRR